MCSDKVLKLITLSQTWNQEFLCGVQNFFLIFLKKKWRGENNF
jgi:hypothetical protein